MAGAAAVSHAGRRDVHVLGIVVPEKLAGCRHTPFPIKLVG